MAKHRQSQEDSIGRGPMKDEAQLPCQFQFSPTARGPILSSKPHHQPLRRLGRLDENTVITARAVGTADDGPRRGS